MAITCGASPVSRASTATRTHWPLIYKVQHCQDQGRRPDLPGPELRHQSRSLGVGHECRRPAQDPWRMVVGRHRAVRQGLPRWPLSNEA
ncbi:MAG: hypothetical protein MZW92_46300 [Comamonadaceae bacterium]|nr:hypothetical protein [Comamonadaceae bacterium]